MRIEQIRIRLEELLALSKLKIIILNDFCGPKHKKFKGPLQGKETVLKNLISGAICPHQRAFEL